MLLVIILLSFCLRTINTLQCVEEFCIGALFDIRDPISPYEPTIKCKKINEVLGIQRIEAALSAMKSIKESAKILPGVTLGLNIEDTCRIPNLALYKALFLIKDVGIYDMYDTSRIQFGFSEVPFEIHEKRHNSKTIAIMGPATIDEITEVQNLLKLFNIPQMGYSDLMPARDHKSKYSTFVRVLSCNTYQANVIRDVVTYFNWNYVSAIYTADHKLIMESFSELLKDDCNNIIPGTCIVKKFAFDLFHNETHYHSAINELAKTKSNVIICFCDNDVLRKIFQTIKELNLTDRFTIVASDSWEDRNQITRGLEEQVWGSIFICIRSLPIPEFSKYYTSLKPSIISANKWFNEFWEDKFNCTLPNEFKIYQNDKNSNIIEIDVNSSRKPCTGNESLATNYQEQKKNGYVMKAIWTIAHGLHNMITEVCGANYYGTCEEMKPFNHSNLVRHLKNLSFVYDDEIMLIDENGHPTKKYDILNFQKLPNNTFEFVSIGKWKNAEMKIFGKFQSKGNKTVTSICSLPCTLGQYRVFTHNENDQNCCWMCKNCDDREYVSSDGGSCIKCLQGEKPNVNRTACDKIPYSQQDWLEPKSIMVVSFTITGFIFTFFTYGVFLKYKNTPIVKSSSWELCKLILFSMILAHTSVFFIMATPTTLTCILSRILPGVAFSIMFASLFIKTRRIARILAVSKNKFPRKQYKLMSMPIQVAISLFYAAIEAAICFMAMIIYPPQPETEYSPEGYPSLTCTKIPLSAIIPFILIGYLLVLCTIYAIKARNIPGNFNETKFIAFAILISIIIWTAFYPIFFCTEYKLVTFSMCTTLTASMMMVFLFFPKLYIIIFKPELNNRALFITNKSIRTHIGRSAGVKQSHLDDLPIYSIYDMKFGKSERGCHLRNVAVQTSSKLLRNFETYNQHKISSTQIYSSSDDEFISDDDNQSHSHYKNVNTLVEIENDKSINQPSNDVSNSKNKLSSMVTTGLNSLRAKCQKNPINNMPSMAPKRRIAMNIVNLLQNNNTRENLQFQNYNLELNDSENVSKKNQQSIHLVKHTRIHEERTPELHNGDPIFNITISLSPEA
ncbi:hypothetical protein PV328_009999 [Microctonus aethiopoides]|uniref:G-protein coupled receptors family 3 profile domain-containing protein n=1 Tax=Microctonus aethiopoides TaxID=144406 RepID=A0AA39C7B4_9HYME|nr:hypothetical protein PV328_009999 [Microctonus aethiopoides]